MLESTPMTNMDRVLAEAMKLNDEERAHVANQLLRSVGDAEAIERAAIERALDEGEADVEVGRVHSMSDVINELRGTL